MCTVRAVWYSQLSAEAVTMLFGSCQICLVVPRVVRGVPRAASSSFHGCSLLNKKSSAAFCPWQAGHTSFRSFFFFFICLEFVLGIVNIIVVSKWFHPPTLSLLRHPAVIPSPTSGGRRRSGSEWIRALSAASPRPTGAPSPSCLVNACMVCHGQWVQWQGQVVAG